LYRRIAHLALHIDVGHEIHFNAPLPVALAGFAAASADVEAEAAWLVAALAASGSMAKRSRMGAKT